MRGVLLSSIAALAGCGMLSGLDSLGVSDASADASSVDVTTTTDAALDTETSTATDASIVDAPAIDVDQHDANSVPIKCFGATCKVGDVCCLNANGTSQCAQTQCPTSYVELACSNPSDCPQGYCCLTIPNQTVTGSSCKPTTCGNILCSPLNGSGTSAGCPSNDDCISALPTELPQGYGICF